MPASLLSSLALAATASAQSQPQPVGPIPQLEKIDRQLAAYGMELELRERNGGLVDASDFMNLDKWVFNTEAHPLPIEPASA